MVYYSEYNNKIFFTAMQYFSGEEFELKRNSDSEVFIFPQ